MTKSNVVLLVVFVALLGYYFFVDRASSAPGGGPTVNLILFPEFDVDRAERIEISETLPAAPVAPGGAPAEKKTSSIVLAKTGMNKEWVVATVGDYPAKPEKVADALAKIASFRHGKVYSSNPESHAKLGVDEGAKRVRVFGSSDALVADFFVGKSGHGQRTTFIRRGDSNDVLLVNDPLAPVYATFKNNWFDNLLVPADVKKVKSCEVSWPEGGLTLVRKADKDWDVTAPEAYKAKWNLAESFVRTLTNLRFDDVVKATADETGFDKPLLHAILTLDDGSKHEITAGAKVKDAETKVYLKKAGSEFVFTGVGAVLEAIPKRVEGLREVPEIYGPPLPPPPAPPGPETAGAAAVEPPAATISGIRDWMFRQRFEEAPLVLVGRVVSDDVVTGSSSEGSSFTPSHRKATFEAQEVFKGSDALKPGSSLSVGYSYVVAPGKDQMPVPAFEKTRSYVLFLREGLGEGVYRFAGTPESLFFDWLADNVYRERARALSIPR